MTEYTPHIDEIQQAYVDASTGWFRERLQRAKEFDRWLYSVKEAAWSEGALAHAEAMDYFPENPYSNERP